MIVDRDRNVAARIVALPWSRRSVPCAAVPFDLAGTCPDSLPAISLVHRAMVGNRAVHRVCSRCSHAFDPSGRASIEL